MAYCSSATGRSMAFGAPVQGVTRSKKTPEVIGAIQKLMEQHTAGDPITSLKWTHKTTLKISRELRKASVEVPSRRSAACSRD